MPKDKFPAGIIVCAQQKGWIDEGLVQDWVCMVWSGWQDEGLSRQRSMLGLDAFICHKTDDTKALLHRTNTDLIIIIIPGGMTWLLQLLGVSINKLLKDGLRRCWSDWIMSGEKTDVLHQEQEDEKGRPSNDLQRDLSIHPLGPYSVQSIGAA